MAPVFKAKPLAGRFAALKTGAIPSEYQLGVRQPVRQADAGGL
jgi:hypothetical protein